jgi:hypothetical protein
MLRSSDRKQWRFCLVQVKIVRFLGRFASDPEDASEVEAAAAESFWVAIIAKLIDDILKLDSKRGPKSSVE